jgi:hypothetical protein
MQKGGPVGTHKQYSLLKGKTNPQNDLPTGSSQESDRPGLMHEEDRTSSAALALSSNHKTT